MRAAHGDRPPVQGGTLRRGAGSALIDDGKIMAECVCDVHMLAY